MPDLQIRVIDVYAYRLAAVNTPEFLLLRRAPTVVYAGQWRMIGGKIHEGEAAWQTALREIQEETGYTPEHLWTIPSVNTFYEWKQDRVNLTPAFAAELTSDPVLNHEHDAFAWFSSKEALNLLAWPEQKRLLRLADQMLQQDGILPEWTVSLTSTRTSLL